MNIKGRYRGGIVGNLFIIFFQNPRVKFALFFMCFATIWPKGLKTEYFSRNFWVFKGYFDP